jgi:hypothetical protein
VSRNKDSEPEGFLFGLPVLTPEWQARRDDARQQENDKTRALRAARLAALTKARKSGASLSSPADRQIKAPASVIAPRRIATGQRSR